MKTNIEKKITPLQAAELPTGRYRAGFRIKAQIPGVVQRSSGKHRILGHEVVNCYHVMSRTAGGEMLFGSVEKEAFCKIMRRLERFAGVEIMTYAVMGNHFAARAAPRPMRPAGCLIGRLSRRDAARLGSSAGAGAGPREVP